MAMCMAQTSTFDASVGGSVCGVLKCFLPRPVLQLVGLLVRLVPLVLLAAQHSVAAWFCSNCGTVLSAYQPHAAGSCLLSRHICCVDRSVLPAGKPVRLVRAALGVVPPAPCLQCLSAQICSFPGAWPPVLLVAQWCFGKIKL
jgi:hypothetical protein